MDKNWQNCENHVLTRSSKDVTKFTWTIQNFNYIKKIPSKMISSPNFSAPSNGDIQFCMILYLSTYNNPISMHVKLTKKPSNVIEFFSKLKLCILNVYPESSLYFAKGDANVIQLNENWGFDNFISLSSISEVSGFLQDDKLTFVCEINLVWDMVTTCSTEQFNISDCKLPEDFGNLLDSRKFSDVTLVAGEHKLPAHKAILAARSDVFAAMFENGFKETESNEVIITDTDHEVLQEMLRFIYTGDVPNLKDKSKHLLAAADKYALSNLKAMSEKALFADLSIETAIEILLLADHYNAEQLKENTINFIIINADKIIKTDGWQNMKETHSYLAAEIFEAMFTPTHTNKRSTTRSTT